MIIVKHEEISNIPLLHVVKEDRYDHMLPLIFFIHGFTSAKEHNLHYAYFLADKGFRVILPEALYHGERENGVSEKELFTHFWEIVITAIHEINSLKEHYVKAGLADSDRIGLVGTSMGGIVTLGALTQYTWIKTAVSLMGTPAYEKFSLWQLEQLENNGVPIPFSKEEITRELEILKEYDLSRCPEQLNNRPLLFWHAKNDPMVPFDLTHQFYDAIREDYKHAPEKLTFITDQTAGHKVTRAGVKAAVSWFVEYL